MENYYYLIAALPELTLDHEQIKRLKFGDVLDLIERNLSEDDLNIYRCLLLQNDNRNLLHLIFHEYHNFSFTSFQYPASISLKKLKKYRSDKSELPEYMVDFLNDQSGAFSSLPHIDMELLLRKYFLEYVSKQKSIFLESFFEWQFSLEKSIAQLNQSKYSFLTPVNNKDAEHLSQKVNSESYLDAKQLISEISPFIEQNKYAEIEKIIDRYYWEFANRWTSRFSSEAVFAYMVKLLRLAFWRPIPSKPEAIEQHFNSLIDDIQSNDRLKLPVE